MSDPNPPPEFDDRNYARPNDAWICGLAAEGRPCRGGPDARGRCGAVAECVPVLEVKPGEAKGRWRCTRAGGPCEQGPGPEGSCGRPPVRCSPVPSLRTVRGRVTRLVIAATIAILLILLGIPPWRNAFINPGPLSAGHSGEAFLRSHGVTNQALQCAACHVAGDSGLGGMLTAAMGAAPGPFDFRTMAAAGPGSVTAMNVSCANCHTGRDFHHENAATTLACAFCHVEHRGSGRMPMPADMHCGVCHADEGIMAASVAGNDSTSVAGKARVIRSFASDHPEFRILAENTPDPNTLKFGHALHLTGSTIPLLSDGRKLDCAFCHQPDAAGAYFRPVTFDRHCQVCHSLQFDPETPELQLPHGSPGFVSAFLQSLPRQYRDVAIRSGITGAEEQRRFVEEKLRRLRDLAVSGEELESRVFFSTSLTGPAARVGTVDGLARAVYPGCAYCHEVTASAQGRPEVTHPMQTPRWLKNSDFRHSTHMGVACVDCHAAEQSGVTSDIILPGKESCVSCHSPRGGVVDTCVTCHSYHKGK